MRLFIRISPTDFIKIDINLTYLLKIKFLIDFILNPVFFTFREPTPIYAQYKMSKTNTKVDLASVVPRTSPKKILEYYERVSKEAEQILKGELKYSKAVNREELIKPTLQEQQEIKEALDEDFNFIKEVGKTNS